MIRNYLKNIYRSLKANRTYSMITIAGLGVGIAVCLVIFVFITYEQSFDGMHHNKARIYRVMTKGDMTVGKAVDSGSAVPFPLPTALENDYPSWRTTAVFALENVQIMALDKEGHLEKKFKEKNGIYLAQPSFFSIFDMPFLQGDANSSLTDRNGAVLTKSTAERYFGDWRKAVGRTLKLQDHDLLLVKGILADPPQNSDFQQSKIFISYYLADFSKSTDWWTTNGDHMCYTLLPENVSLATANQQLAALSKKYRTPDNKSIQVLQPLTQVHFDVKSRNYSGRTISIDRICSLWLIAGFILLIACVNFINISTAQAVNRAKEVGVRKVLGSSRLQLRMQFLLETLLLVAASVLLAVLLVLSLQDPVSRSLDIPVSSFVILQKPVLLFLCATTLAVTLLAGFYPALVLSRFNPVQALKTRLAARTTSGINLRRGLVVLQFVIAQTLIIGTLLIVRQMNYFTHQSMGFDQQAIVNIPFPGDSLSQSKLDYLRHRLSELRSVQQVCYNNASPSETDNWHTGFNFDHAKKGIDFAAISRFGDANYLSTYGLKLVAGRNLIDNDSIKEFLVNETLVKKLGFSDPQAVVNKEINLWNGWAKGPIVGVIRDFHQSSLRDSLNPVFMLNYKPAYSIAGIKLDGRDLSGTMKSIEKIWSDIYPNFVFEYEFQDEKIAGFYKEESKLSLFYKVFASIAIFLSCLGLYGLASFMAAQRVKEVGIRKVLGATAGHILYLFSKEFVVLIGIAFLISTPIAWYFVHQWLQQYAFRITISGWIFVGGGLLALLIALVTISVQTFKAASANPVKNLRTE
ncbi:MAG TPA: ABC transporter permease [Puia sp.]|nr:ABC transporter permease [Puia sp.]